jgi:hypothetical protein
MNIMQIDEVVLGAIMLLVGIRADYILYRGYLGYRRYYTENGLTPDNTIRPDKNTRIYERLLKQGSALLKWSVISINVVLIWSIFVLVRALIISLS